MFAHHHLSSDKATHQQLRRHNQQLLLRAVYQGRADNRAALSQETGLAKPTVSDLVAELLADGLLIEEGKGGSTESGGRRPRLLKFVPTARQVIGVSLNEERVLGVLARLDGQIVVDEVRDLAGARGEAVIAAVMDTIAALAARCEAPRLCVGVGVAGLVDVERGIVRYAQHLGLRDIALVARLEERFGVPVTLGNDTELAALGHYVYGAEAGEPPHCLATVLVGSGVGIGLILQGTLVHGGGDLGHLLVVPPENVHSGGSLPGLRLEQGIGWPAVRQRVEVLRGTLPSSRLPGPGQVLTYDHIRQAVEQGDPAALRLLDELSSYLAQAYSWIIGLLRPDHIALAGSVTALGPALLDRTTGHLRAITLPNLMENLTLSLAGSPHLVAVGAVAHALRCELGLV